MKLQKILSLLFFMCLSVCAGKPDWVKGRPVSSDYYIGIGIAQKGNGISSEDLATVAKQRALNDLISEISVKIKGAGVVDAEAVGDSLQERYFEEIRSETEANLSGHEFVGEYKKGKMYYVYYRLKKSKWARIENERLQKAISLCRKHLENGGRYDTAGEPLSAIEEYVNAYSVLIPVLYLNPRSIFDGSEKILTSVIKGKIKSVAKRLELVHPYPMYNGVRKLYGPGSAKVQVKYGASIVDNFPIHIGSEDYLSRKEGFYVTPDIIGDEDTVSIELTIPVEALSPLCEQSVVIKSWLATVSWPRSELQFVFRRPAILLEAHEKSLDEEVDNPSLKPALEELFSSKGYHLKNLIGDAEVVISIKGNTRTISAFSSLFFVYLDVVAEVQDKNGKKLFTKRFKPIKGGGLDYDQASIKAYEKAAPFVAKELFQWSEDNL